MPASLWAKSKGCKQLSMHVFSNNERAFRFNLHLGYQTEIENGKGIEVKVY
ncbi:hypothetical protein [Bacillus sp. M6-12]|uniref:hypothetical protein n=1 Tax=Bacillus sp. M6-12 TaxID=2054166 RepID=UPI0015E08D0B|nr:hypothetical protein [Bacillus sp. M6-12]